MREGGRSGKGEEEVAGIIYVRDSYSLWGGGLGFEQGKGKRWRMGSGEKEGRRVDMK